MQRLTFKTLINTWSHYHCAMTPNASKCIISIHVSLASFILQDDSFKQSEPSDISNPESFLAIWIVKWHILGSNWHFLGFNLIFGAGRAEQNLLRWSSKWLQWRNRLAHGTYRQYKEICRGCEFEPHLEQQRFLLREKSFLLRKKIFLPDRESNPGLPRDRRRSSPLDYRGIGGCWPRTAPEELIIVTHPK